MSDMQSYTQDLLHHMGIQEATATVEESETHIHVNIQVPPEDAGKMIGSHGQTLQGLRQVLFSTFLPQLNGKKIVVNVNDYTQKREEEAVALGRRAAERALADQEAQYLTPHLTANQRRAIHQDLTSYAGIATKSVGEGFDRQLVIYPESLTLDEQNLGEVMVDTELTDGEMPVGE